MPQPAMRNSNNAANAGCACLLEGDFHLPATDETGENKSRRGMLVGA